MLLDGFRIEGLLATQPSSHASLRCTLYSFVWPVGELKGAYWTSDSLVPWTLSTGLQHLHRLSGVNQLPSLPIRTSLPHPSWTHSLPNMSLEDLKTLTLSVQALWMFTPGSSPEVSPIISLPLAVTSELNLLRFLTLSFFPTVGNDSVVDYTPKTELIKRNFFSCLPPN